MADTAVWHGDDTDLVVLDGSPQFQRQQEEQLNQEEANDEIAVDRIGIGLLLAADQTETDERHRQEYHAGHQTDISDHIFCQRWLRQRLSKTKREECCGFVFQRETVIGKFDAYHELFLVHYDGHWTQAGASAVDVEILLVVEPRIVEIGSATFTTPASGPSLPVDALRIGPLVDVIDADPILDTGSVRLVCNDAPVCRQSGQAHHGGRQS